MAALAPGNKAPDFTLDAMDGSRHSLHDLLQHGPVVAFFFKVSCPVCQYAAPFIERIYKAHGDKHVRIVGISQNERKDTIRFIKEYGLTFPVLLDDTSNFPVSNDYGLTNVPTTFWIAQNGPIELSIVGWSRREIEEINQRIASLANTTAGPVLFHPGEQIADFRAG